VGISIDYEIFSNFLFLVGGADPRGSLPVTQRTRMFRVGNLEIFSNFLLERGGGRVDPKGHI
jgi:hypothetical protein